jgi:hypothetical protein
MHPNDEDGNQPFRWAGGTVIGVSKADKAETRAVGALEKSDYLHASRTPPRSDNSGCVDRSRNTVDNYALCVTTARAALGFERLGRPSRSARR